MLWSRPVAGGKRLARGETAWPVRGAVAVRWVLMQPPRARQDRITTQAWAKTQRHRRTQAWTRHGRTELASWVPARSAAPTVPPATNAAVVAPGRLENANATSDASPRRTAALPIRCAAARQVSAPRFAFRRVSVSADEWADLLNRLFIGPLCGVAFTLVSACGGRENTAASGSGGGKPDGGIGASSESRLRLSSTERVLRRVPWEGPCARSPRSSAARQAAHRQRRR